LLISYIPDNHNSPKSYYDFFSVNSIAPNRRQNHIAACNGVYYFCTRVDHIWTN